MSDDLPTLERAEEGDFGGVEGARRVGKVVGAHGGEQEFWNEAHGLSLSLVEAVCAETQKEMGTLE